MAELFRRGSQALHEVSMVSPFRVALFDCSFNELLVTDALVRGHRGDDSLPYSYLLLLVKVDRIRERTNAPGLPLTVGVYKPNPPDVGAFVLFENSPMLADSWLPRHVVVPLCRTGYQMAT